MKNLAILSLFFLFTACKMDKYYDSFEIRQYKNEYSNGAIDNSEQVNFTMEGLGSLSLASLFKVNILPIKVYGTALLLMEKEADHKKIDSRNLPFIMQKYGFLHPSKIANWKNDLSAEPKIDSSLGFIHTQIKQTILGKKISIEVANITCAACHSSVTYDADGKPKNEAWLGAGSTSLNLDGFLNQIYFGLKKGMVNPENFMKKIREAYPLMDSVEEQTIRKYIFPKLMSSLKDYKAMDRVLPFPNGGPGHTNGIGAFKRDAGILKKPFLFHAEEAGIVSIPNIMDRGFRSSLTIDGAYAVKGKERFAVITREEAIKQDHLDELAELASFFTYSAMGNNINNIEPNMPKVKDIVSNFLSDVRPQQYPGTINQVKALRGERIYKKSCASCHGDYSPGVENIELLSFQNLLIY